MPGSIPRIEQLIDFLRKKEEKDKVPRKSNFVYLNKKETETDSRAHTHQQKNEHQKQRIE